MSVAPPLVFIEAFEMSFEYLIMLSFLPLSTFPYHKLFIFSAWAFSTCFPWACPAHSWTTCAILKLYIFLFDWHEWMDKLCHFKFWCFADPESQYKLSNRTTYKILFYNFIIFLYMFRALLCSSSGGQSCIIEHLVSSHTVSGRPIHLCSGRPPTECDDARCCIRQLWPPDNEHNSARNM